ncbi:MAG: leucine-rich repeat domain-containing protein [Paludibacter sp.]|nr:leucine-rich repeat domain-containing protein [Paludibacter sp.]
MKTKIIIIVFCLFGMLGQNITAQNTNNEKRYHTNNAIYTLLDNGTVSLDSFIVQPAGAYRIPLAIVIDGKEYTVSLLKQKSFLNSSELTSVVIPAGVDSIGYGMFGNCFKLMEIVVDEENKKFRSDDGILYSKDGAKLYFFPIKKSEYQKGRFVTNENVKEIIPYAFVNNFYKQIILSEVEKIRTGAFYQCSELEYIFINNSVYDISGSAFSKCRKLEYVNFQEGSKLQSIKANTFSECYKLNKFDNFPEHIKYIGDYAFNNCYGLIDFKVPDGVTSLGEYSFRNCQNLKTITLPESLKTINNRSFYNCLHLSSVTIPDSVTKIGEGAFIFCEKLESVKMPAQLDSLNSRTFGYCKKLKYIDFPTTLHTIGDYAFQNTGLTTITIPQNVTSLLSHAFIGCEDLTFVVLIGGGSCIPDSIFMNCKKLEHVEMANNFKSIGKSAFYSTGLKQVDLPLGIEEIDNYAFANCDSLHTIKLNEGLHKINDHAFENCKNLFSVNLPNSLKHIGFGAFQDCYNLKEINFPDNISEIESFAFSGCCNLKSVIIPPCITKINSGTFAKCNNMESLTLHDNITGIDEEAFLRCYNLSTIHLPNNLTYLETRAFYYCFSIKNIEIPSKVTYIGEGAFSGCTALTTVLMHENITKIGADAFFDCPHLKSIYIRNAMPPEIGYNTFFKKQEYGTFYIPKGSKKNYKAASNWNLYPIKELDVSKMEFLQVLKNAANSTQNNNHKHK